MSLTVPTTLLEQAREGNIRTDDFLQCIKESLPYAWQLVEELAGRLHAGNEKFVDNQVPPPDEQARGQLLRVLASDSMRHALETHYGVSWPFRIAIVLRCLIRSVSMRPTRSLSHLGARF